MPSTIFRGTKVKTLKDILTLNDKADIIASTTDPTSVAVDAPIGSLLLNQTNGKLYRKLDSGSSTNWSLVGSGTGNVNFVSNGDSEAGTTGVVTYADAAGVAPVDGTGGSPNVTVTSSATSPLDGLRSFLFTKDAANRQGQGWSIDYSISTQYRGGIADISFYYSINSGTYADGDVRVYMYDVTNSLLIEPTPLTLLNFGNASKRVSKFQFPINSSSYRLIFHVASTSASAYELKLDSIQVSPQSVAYGATVTDWQSFTPTGSWSTNTTYSGYWRRVGDMAEYNVQLALTGAPTATGLSINLVSGQVIDTTKIVSSTASENVLGIVTLLDSGTQNYRISEVRYASTTAVGVWAANSPTAPTDTAQVSNTSPFTFANGDRIWVRFSVPISGWSSNVVVSDQADTRVCAAIITGDPASATSGNPIIVPTVVLDTHGSYNATTGRYTASSYGVFKLYGALQSASAATTLSIYKNAVLYCLAGSLDSNGEATFAGSVQCSAGDLIDIRPGGTVDATNMTLNIEKLSGPAQVAASEKVEVQYSTPATTSMTSGTEYFNSWTVKIRDTHNAVLGSSSALVTTTNTGWRFIAPRAGFYKYAGISNINSATGFNGTSETFFGSVYVNGVDTQKMPDVLPGSGQGFPTLPFSGAVYLNAGDRLEFSISQLSGGALSQQASTNARISIWSD